MDSEIIRAKKDYKGFPGCYKLYRILVWIGNKFYVWSETCAWYSRDRQRKIAADEAWEKKMAVGEIVLDTPHLGEEILRTEEIEVGCKETVEELGSTYVNLKQELENTNRIIYDLWDAFSDNDMEEMGKIFQNIGFTKENL